MASPTNESPALISRIKETENRRSLFEAAVRKLPISVCSVFAGEDRKIMPATFKPSDIRLTGEHHERVMASFPRSIAQNQNIVLEGVRSASPRRVNGKRVAVLFSGGPAAGGHNVLAGIKAVLGPGNTLLGVRKGPRGLLNDDLFEITAQDTESILNTGGFDLLGTDRTKIKAPEQFARVKDTVLKNGLNGIIVVGGDDSNTNAALIAEYLLENNIQCSIIGVPKTIDGDMSAGKLLPISFGFDTATKTYSELVGNLTQDAASAVKYWHFVKLMGRTASKITLEVALQTKPAVALISEEIAEKNMSLEQVVDHIVNVITQRRLKGVNHGVILVPEGLIEFIPEMRILIKELNYILAEYHSDIQDLPTLKNKQEYIYPLLSPQSAQLMASLPEEIEEMLILDRDDHGNVKVSLIETEKLLIEKVRYKMSQMKRHTDKYFGREKGKIDATPEQIERFKSVTLATQAHFFGYEGRSAKPAAFDQTFAFALGLAAGSLVLAEKTGYMAAITDLDKGGRVLAIPLSGLITCELRKGKEELVIEKSLVSTSSAAFTFFAQHRERWAQEDLFSSPGPIQHWGPTRKQLPISVALDQGYAEYEGFDLGEELQIDFEY